MDETTTTQFWMVKGGGPTSHRHETRESAEQDPGAAAIRAAYLAEDVIRLFGDHTTAIGLLMHLSLLAKGMPDGGIRDGITIAAEEGAAWLDRQAGDGRDSMQTLMEHVTGLLNGSYAIVDVGAPIQTIDHPAPEPHGWSDTARQMLAAHDLFMSGAGVTPAQKADADRLVLPACFAAEAYDRLGGGEDGTMALLRAFLLAVIDPASPELDYLRAGTLPAAPLSGEGE